MTNQDLTAHVEKVLVLRLAGLIVDAHLQDWTDRRVWFPVEPSMQQHDEKRRASQLLEDGTFESWLLNHGTPAEREVSYLTDLILGAMIKAFASPQPGDIAFAPLGRLLLDIKDRVLLRSEAADVVDQAIRIFKERRLGDHLNSEASKTTAAAMLAQLRRCHVFQDEKETVQ